MGHPAFEPLVPKTKHPLPVSLALPDPPPVAWYRTPWAMYSAVVLGIVLVLATLLLFATQGGQPKSSGSNPDQDIAKVESKNECDNPEAQIEREHEFIKQVVLQQERAEVAQKFADEQQALAADAEERALKAMLVAQKFQELADTQKLDIEALSKEAEQLRTLATEAAKAALEVQRIADDARATAAKLREQADTLKYAQLFLLAQREFRTGNAERTRRLLEDCPVKRRGWEHQYLMSRLPQLAVNTFGSHTGAVNSVVFAPDGNRIIAGGEDKISIVDLFSGEARPRWSLQQLKSGIREVHLNADNKQLALALSDGRVVLCDAKDGEVNKEFKPEGKPLVSTAYSPDGKKLLIAWGDKDTLVVHDLIKDKIAMTVTSRTFRVTALAYSPQGKHFAAADGTGGVHVWDAESGEELWSKAGNSEPAFSIAFSPDGEILAVAGEDRRAVLWNAATGKELHVLTHAEGIMCVRFSPTSPLVATAGRDRLVKLWDTKLGQLVHTLPRFEGSVNSVAFSPVGNRLLCGDSTGKITLHRIGLESRDWTVDTYQDGLVGLAFNPRGKALATVGDKGHLKVWNPATGKLIVSIDKIDTDLTCVAFSPNGKWLAVGDARGNIFMVEVGNWANVQKVAERLSQIFRIAFSADNSRLIAVGSKETWGWEVSDEGKLGVRPVVMEGGRDVAFSSDGQTIFLCQKASVLMRPLANVKGSQYYWTGGGVCAALDRDDRNLVVGTQDGRLLHFDTKQGDREISTLDGHTARITSLGFSPNGNRLVSASEDKTVRLWDLATGIDLLRLDDYRTAVRSVAFSPDGTSLATVDAEGVIRMRCVERNVEPLLSLTHTLRHSNTVNSCAFHPDGKRLVSGAGRTLRLWTARDGKEVVSIEDKSRTYAGASFHPDGKTLIALESSRDVVLMDINKLEEKTRFASGEDLTAFEVSPDGKRIFVVDRGKLKAYDYRTKQELYTSEERLSYASPLVCMNNGKRVVCIGSDNNVRVIDAETGKLAASYQPSTVALRAIACSPDGKWIASADKLAAITLWDTTTEKTVCELKGSGSSATQCIAFSPNGRILVEGGIDGKLRLWDLRTKTIVTERLAHLAEITRIQFSSDGTTIATSSVDNTVRIWELSGFATSGIPEIVDLKGHSHEVKSVAFSPDGKFLVSAGWDHVAKIWNVESGLEVMTLKGSTKGLYTAGFSSDGKLVAGGGAEGVIRIWETEKGEEKFVLKGHTSFVTGVAFHSDGKRLFSCSADGSIKVWNLAEKKAIETLNAHQTGVRSIVFSRDGKRFASAGWDAVAKIWDAESYKEIRTLKGHSDAIGSVSFSPDDLRILTTGMDCTWRIWDVEKGTESLRRRDGTEPVRAAFLSDGKRLVIAEKPGEISLRAADGAGYYHSFHNDQPGPIAIAVNPQGNRLAASFKNGMVRLWIVP